MHILVTGGAGYIGSHTVRHLLARGHRIVIVDLQAIAPRGPLAGARGVVADVRDTGKISELLREEQIEAVIHLAGLKSVAESMDDPGAYFDTNVAGSLSVLRAMAAVGTRSLVFSSSCAVYGTPTRLPVDELQPLRPESPYGASKMMVEDMLRWFGRIHGMQIVSLRYFNAAGADLDAAIGEDWDRSTMLVPALMKAALHERGPVDIFGTDYPTPDGTAIRDFVHVLDLADAHIRAVEIPADGTTNGVFALNLGRGVGASVREVISIVEDVSGRSVPVRWTDRRAGDPAQVWADPSRARVELGWEARYDLHTIVETAWAWHSSRVRR